MEKIVDAKGFACPQPVLMAKDALKGMTEGELKVLVDNEISVQNLTKLGKSCGLEVTSGKKAEAEFEVVFHVTESAATAMASNDEIACNPDERKKGLVVVISSDQMGNGNEELGKILMKGFIFALTKLDALPETVLLYNGGAKLSVEGSESLDDLKMLEALGVEILTCGTCLNYYGLSEKLAVGNVSNMYEIAEKMTLAGSVVRP